MRPEGPWQRWSAFLNIQFPRPQTVLGRARPALLSLPAHLSTVLPCPPSPEGMGNYPPHPRVPQEGKDRRGGPHVVKKQPDLRCSWLLPLAQLSYPFSQDPCLLPPRRASGNEVEAGLPLAGIATPARIVVDRPYPGRYDPMLAWPERNW